MDKFGVPKKVNRHVIKAVNRLTKKGCNKMKFTSIFDVVEETMKNTLPTPNFRTAVKQSLHNFCKLGVVEKIGTSFYKPIDPLEVLPRTSAPKPEISRQKAEEKEHNKSINPVQGKKRMNSDDSPENDPNRPIKRLRTGKSPSEKGQLARSSKVRIRRTRFIDEVQRENGRQSFETEDKREKNRSIPTQSKRRMKSDESTPQNDPSRAVKRLYTGKSSSGREQPAAHLSKVRIQREELQDELQLDGRQFFENQGINNSSFLSETRSNFNGFETSVTFGSNEIHTDSIQTSAENHHTLSADIQDPQPESSGSSVLSQSTISLISIERSSQGELESQREPEPSSNQDDKGKDEQNQDDKGEDEDEQKKGEKSVEVEKMTDFLRSKQKKRYGRT